MLLQIKPNHRPAATQITDFYVPNVLKNLGKFEGYSYDILKHFDEDKSSVIFGPSASKEYMEASTATMNELTLAERSILYLMKSFDSNCSLDPVQLPSTCKIRDVAMSEAHFLVATEDGCVYGWGDGQKGQLGFNIESTWKHFPSKIETIQRHNIINVCAGEGYSLFLNNYGVVLVCGSSKNGCLGIESVTSLMTPRVIEKFSDTKIIQIACNKVHVLALDVNGDVYSFGFNEHGALGLGSKISSMTPQRINFASTLLNVKKIYCAPDCSLILTHEGDVYACGRNNFNRFGFGRSVNAVNEFVSYFLATTRISYEFSFSFLEKNKLKNGSR